MKYLGPDLKTREGAETYALKVVQKGARTNFEEDGCVAPACFVFGTWDPSLGRDFPGGFGVIYVKPVMDFNERGKDFFAKYVRWIASESKAVGVIFVTECWMVFQEDISSIQQAMDEWNKYGKTLAKHPARKEMILLNLEHVTGNRSWACEIVREKPGDSESPGKLADWQEMPKATERVGRLTGLNYQWD